MMMVVDVMLVNYEFVYIVLTFVYFLVLAAVANKS